jgi:hypothetical protein
MLVQIECVGDKLFVYSPYSDAFVKAAKALGGKWSSSSWAFSIHDEERVRALCIEIYGDDGTTAIERCTLRIEWLEENYTTHGPVECAGRVIASATGRDSGARLGEGVALIKGKVTSGGSSKNWQTIVLVGTVAVVHDFPLPTAEKLIADQPSTRRRYSIEKRYGLDVDALRAEKTALLARLGEINKQLGEES